MKNLINIVRYPGPVKEAPATVTLTITEGKKVLAKLHLHEDMTKKEIELALLQTVHEMLVAK